MSKQRGKEFCEHCKEPVHRKLLRGYVHYRNNSPYCPGRSAGWGAIATPVYGEPAEEPTAKHSDAQTIAGQEPQTEESILKWCGTYEHDEQWAFRLQGLRSMLERRDAIAIQEGMRSAAALVCLKCKLDIPLFPKWKGLAAWHEDATANKTTCDAHKIWAVLAGKPD